MFKNGTQEELDDLAARVEQLNSRVAELWSRITASALPLPGSRREDVFGGKELLGVSLESLARRAGFQLTSGASIETVLRTAVQRVEQAAGRSVERWLATTVGGGLMGSFAGGAGVALLEAGMEALVRAFQKRRLTLPEVEERPFGGFPRYAQQQMLMPSGTERDDSLERSLARRLARTLAEEK